MKLKRIRLPLKQNDPRISLRKAYLAKVEGQEGTGKFTREWYGLNFKGIYNAGCQWNYDWQGLWEICQ